MTGKIRAELLTHWSIHTAGQPAEMNLSNSCTALHIQFPVQLSDQERTSKELYVSLYNSGQLKPVTLHTGALTKSIQDQSLHTTVTGSVHNRDTRKSSDSQWDAPIGLYDVRTNTHTQTLDERVCQFKCADSRT